MRTPALLMAASVWLSVEAAVAEPAPPPADALIISMAQQFVLQHFHRPVDKHFDVAFDVVDIHPQPDPGYWAVIGGFMANSEGANYRPHGFGVAIRLICDDHDKLECWQLEKLVIDRKIILNN